MTLGRASMALSSAAIFLVLLLNLLLRGDFTRHLTDHLQHLWLITYSLSGNQLYSDAWLRGWAGSVLQPLRLVTQPVPLCTRIGVVEGSHSALDNGSYLLMLLLLVLILASAYSLVWRSCLLPKQVARLQFLRRQLQPEVEVAKARTTAEVWVSMFLDLFYILFWPLLFYSLACIKLGSDSSALAVAWVVVLLCAGVTLALGLYIFHSLQALLRNQGVATLSRVPQDQVGAFMLLAKLGRKIAITLIVVAFSEHPVYGLGFSLVLDGTLCAVLTVYRPYRHRLQDWANILGQGLVLLVLTLASVLELSVFAQFWLVSQGVAVTIVVVSAVLLAAVFLQAAALLVVQAMAWWRGIDYFEKLMVRDREEELSVQDSQNCEQQVHSALEGKVAPLEESEKEEERASAKSLRVEQVVLGEQREDSLPQFILQTEGEG